MRTDQFYCHQYPTITLEHIAAGCAGFEDFEQQCSDEMLNDDRRIGNYLQELLWKYDKKASVVSVEAMAAPSYVGNLINGKKNNPSRNVLLCICFALGATVEETQYLLKCAGHAPLYVRKKRDVVIWFGLTKGEPLDVVNENLLVRGYAPLYTEK